MKIYGIKTYITVLKQIIGRSLVYMIPRNKHLIVYGGSKDLFIDNTKYMFIMNNESMLNYQHIWITSRQDVIQQISRLGYHVVNAKSLKGYFYMLRAGFILFDDSIRNFSKQGLSFGAVRIQLWHGIPAKWVAGVTSDQPDFYHRRSWFWETFIFDHLHGDYAVTTSHTMDNVYSAMFRIPQERLFLGGYPRLCTFFMTESQRMDYINKYESNALCQQYRQISSLQGRKIIYTPTFRDAKPDYIKDAIPDWMELDAFCKKHNVYLFIKVHRVAKLPNINGLSNVHILSNELDVYPLLPLFDMMISDYSSITYDFSMLNKKIAMYTYDIDDYLLHSRPIPDYFKKIIHNLTNVKDFEGFKHLLIGDMNELNEFPNKECFEAPDDYEAVPRMIISYGKR